MTSKLALMQARFQQKQIQEKEEKLLRLYENQQQRAFDRVSRGSAGSNTSLSSTGGGKVRQMFDERRQKAGVDRSYPLEPLRASKSNNQNRGGSVERVKNSTSKTTVKSTVQKSVNQVRNGKPIVNKREIVHTLYNNNNGVETFEERRFDEDNLNNKHDKSHRDLVDLMNNHNLNDSLDNEEMPQIGFDEPDEVYFTGKLANLGGKLPSESVANVVEQKSTKTNNILGKTFRKDTKPIVRRTVKPASPPQSLNSTVSTHSQPLRTVTSPITSPIRTSMSQTMQTASKTSDIKKNSRAPCTSRPSANQTGKSPVVRDDLNECRYCNRRFAADRLETHENICGKSGKKKRKTYDATKHRVEGTELEQYVKKGGKSISKSRSSNKQAPKKDWRTTHEEFINAIRAAKMAQAHIAKGGKLSDLPPPPPSSHPDYVQCPHCGRKFNEAAAERHIPKCANYEFNKPKPGSQTKAKTSSSKNLR